MGFECLELKRDPGTENGNFIPEFLPHIPEIGSPAPQNKTKTLFSKQFAQSPNVHTNICVDIGHSLARGKAEHVAREKCIDPC